MDFDFFADKSIIAFLPPSGGGLIAIPYPKVGPVDKEAPKPKPKEETFTYPVVISQQPYKVIGKTDAEGKVDKFYVYNASSKKVGEAQAEKIKDPKTGKDKWIPKKGTVKFNKK